MSQGVAQEMPSAASSFPQGSLRKVVASLNRLNQFIKIRATEDVRSRTV